MVKLSSALLVFATLAVSVFASPIEHRDVNKVKADLRQVERDITTFDAAVNGLSTPFTVGQAVQLRAQIGSFARDVDQSTRDVKDVNSVSESDARDIIGEVNNFVPNILDVLRKIEAKKDILLSLPIPGINGIILSSLQDLHQRSTALSDALINAAPADLKNQAEQLKNEVEAEFTKLWAVFSRN
ncbi:hypothetical protein AX14_005548 [Amanita brunnescens Koide BX004]|nr:hypothetical protein AX14_005548 [Amanita brunnescens Koide BX004]